MRRYMKAGTGPSALLPWAEAVGVATLYIGVLAAMMFQVGTAAGYFV